jgi:HicB family
VATQAEQSQVATEPLEEPTHSGRLMVRMPPSLHDELAREAEREGVSLNAFMIGVLAGAIGWRSPGGGERSGPAPAWVRRTMWANLVVVGTLAVIAAVLLVVAIAHGW